MDVNKLSFHELIEIVRNLPKYNVEMILSDRETFDKKKYDFEISLRFVKEDKKLKHPFHV